MKEFNESENENEELESGCESDEDSETTNKKYPIFKLQKNMVNYKWELGKYFSVKSYFKEAITTYVIQFGRGLKFFKNNKKKGYG